MEGLVGLGRKIDDRQAAMPQTGAPFDKKTIRVRTPVSDGIGHFPDQVSAYFPAFQLDNPCDPAHGYKMFL
jgi:hypothetical protein